MDDERPGREKHLRKAKPVVEKDKGRYLAKHASLSFPTGARVKPGELIDTIASLELKKAEARRAAASSPICAPVATMSTPSKVTRHKSTGLEVCPIMSSPHANSVSAIPSHISTTWPSPVATKPNVRRKAFETKISATAASAAPSMPSKASKRPSIREESFAGKDARGKPLWNAVRILAKGYRKRRPSRPYEWCYRIQWLGGTESWETVASNEDRLAGLYAEFEDNMRSEREGGPRSVEEMAVDEAQEEEQDGGEDDGENEDEDEGGDGENL